LQAVAEDRDQQLTDHGPAPAPIRGDINLLRQLLVNLVENAIRHTAPGNSDRACDGRERVQDRPDRQR